MIQLSAGDGVLEPVGEAPVAAEPSQRALLASMEVMDMAAVARQDLEAVRVAARLTESVAYFAGVCP